MASISVSAHGTSFQVQDSGRVDRVTRYGWGLEVASYRYTGEPGPAAWVHAPIPIAAAWEIAPLVFHDSVFLEEIEESVQLIQVNVELDASADRELRVTDLHVWNGGSRVAAFDGLSERGPSLTRSFEPSLELEGENGLSLSIGVEFPVPIDEPDGNPPPAPALVFFAAYAFFTVQS